MNLTFNSFALPAIIKTPRFELHRVEVSDISWFWQQMSDPEQMRYIRPPLTDKAAFEAEFCADIEADLRYKNYRLIRWPDSDETLGMVLLRPHERGMMELGYIIARAHWGKGIAFEAAQAMFAHARDTWQVKELIATVQRPNIASVKTLEKIGFKDMDEPLPDSDAHVFMWYA